MATGTIRVAAASDLAAIVRIYNASIPGRLATADTEPVTVAQREDWFRAFDPAHRPLWVLEDGGEVRAWLGLRSFQGRPAYEKTVEAAVYVDPDHQRRGYAGRLLAHALEAAPGLGVANVLALVFAHNEPTVALFMRHGFSGWGRLPRVAELDGVERDLLILGRRL
jgi:phosphinothricin acetyltransferase